MPKGNEENHAIFILRFGSASKKWSGDRHLDDPDHRIHRIRENQ